MVLVTYNIVNFCTLHVLYIYFTPLFPEDSNILLLNSMESHVGKLMDGQESAVGPYPESVESSQYSHTLFLQYLSGLRVRHWTVIRRFWV
jgi:hypothetical protein